MSKKQTRRSISVSGDTYNAVRDYCDKHGLSASGLVTDLLNKYLIDNADGPPPGVKYALAEERDEEETEETVTEPAKSTPPVAPTQLSTPQVARDVSYPDRRGPGFAPLQEGGDVSSWVVTAQIEIARRRQVDAHASVETLLHNLMHRRMVNSAQVVKVESSSEK
jgi:peptidoglycan hydrolase-like protein with peptidoglycan-binding domain